MNLGIIQRQHIVIGCSGDDTSGFGGKTIKMTWSIFFGGYSDGRPLTFEGARIERIYFNSRINIANHLIINPDWTFLRNYFFN